jgi:hypothetical protein
MGAMFHLYPSKRKHFMVNLFLLMVQDRPVCRVVNLTQSKSTTLAGKQKI